MENVIKSIDTGSRMHHHASPGDMVVSINGNPIRDVLDYKFYSYDRRLTIVLRSPEGKERTVKIRKNEGEDLGLNFESYLMDRPRSCANNCVFCFIDQLPKGMRKTMYFKDDDARLSFLLGNYVTLTNFSPREVQRIMDLRISPINVSVQATEPQLRRTLLGNKNADRSIEYMRAFGKAGIEMNGQIVVCPGWNDGEHLRRTIEDLMEIGTQRRPSLYNLRAPKPYPLVPSGLNCTVTERIRYDGSVETPLDEEETREVVRYLKAQGVQAIAVCTLFSFINPAHEERIGEIIAEEFPEAYVTLSSRLAPEFREYSRMSTTVMNSYLGPVMKKYVNNFRDSIADLGIRVEPYVTQSNGSIISIRETIDCPIKTALSGPSAGVIAASWIGKQCGAEKIITFGSIEDEYDVYIGDGGGNVTVKILKKIHFKFHDFFE